jgi:hypothetical protein
MVAFRAVAENGMVPSLPRDLMAFLGFPMVCIGTRRHCLGAWNFLAQLIT